MSTPGEPTLSRRELWDERHRATDPIEMHEPDPTLVTVAAELAPGRALDLGSGDGRNAIWLAMRGWQVTAVDFSAVGIERAQVAAAPTGVQIDWVLEDLLEFQPPTGSFDLVALMFIHLPTEERREVYRRAADAVAPGGTLLVVGHDRRNLTEGIGGPRDPAVLFTPTEVAADLSGFDVVVAEATRRGDALPAPIDAVVRAIRPTVAHD